MVRCISN